MHLFRRMIYKLHDKKAQVLLPAVMLAPIFILVIYLLFETAKVSMTKMRQQFALDNSAYSQVSSLSTYLNAVAMVNGPLPYRVMKYYAEPRDAVKPTDSAKAAGEKAVSIFELFYQGGGVPTIAPDYETGINDAPKPESTDWGVKYSEKAAFSRKDWQNEQPKLPGGDEYVPLMSEELLKTRYFPALQMATSVIAQYLETYIRTGSIYDSQSYVYKETSKNLSMFREAYYLNTDDCKRSECGRQSANQLRQYLNISTKPFKLDKVRFYATDSGTSGEHGSAIPLDLILTKDIKDTLFQFAYLDPSSRGRLRTLGHGIKLKQPFKLPRNYFNVNLEKYKPYVHTTVRLECPRANNNCVWPNPLPKYNVTLDP